jgi:hypothetical protein
LATLRHNRHSPWLTMLKSRHAPSILAGKNSVCDPGGGAWGIARSRPLSKGVPPRRPRKPTTAYDPYRKPCPLGERAPPSRSRAGLMGYGRVGDLLGSPIRDFKSRTGGLRHGTGGRCTCSALSIPRPPASASAAGRPCHHRSEGSAAPYRLRRRQRRTGHGVRLLRSNRRAARESWRRLITHPRRRLCSAISSHRIVEPSSIQKAMTAYKQIPPAQSGECTCVRWLLRTSRSV